LVIDSKNPWPSSLFDALPPVSLFLSFKGKEKSFCQKKKNRAASPSFSYLLTDRPPFRKTLLGFVCTSFLSFPRLSHFLPPSFFFFFSLNREIKSLFQIQRIKIPTTLSFSPSLPWFFFFRSFFFPSFPFSRERLVIHFLFGSSG